MKHAYRDNTIEFEDVSSFNETEAALQVSIPEIEDGKLFWIPKSQISDASEIYRKNQTKGILIISEWIALQKEFI